MGKGGITEEYRRVAYGTRAMTEAALRWASEREDAVTSRFDADGTDPTRAPMPPMYASVDAACRQLYRAAKAWEATSDKNKRSKMDIGDVVDIIVANAAFTLYMDGNGKALYAYDYDKGVYTLPDDLVDRYVNAVTGRVITSQKASIIDTISTRRESLVPYSPLPRYKITVGNGVFNLLTREMEDPDPRFVALTRIATDYRPEAVEVDPRLFHGLTFWELCQNFANGEPLRVRLLEEMCLSLVVTKPSNDCFFIVVGDGGDGKSTFFGDMLGTVLGAQSVANLNFDDINADDKMINAEGKKMIYGNDNRDNLVLQSQLARLKLIATNERMTVSRKYLSARAMAVTGIMVQLCNTFPTFPSENAAMARRVVSMRAENSFYSNDSADAHIPHDVRTKAFAEHALACILSLPFRMSYNDVDSALMRDSMDMGDTLGQFIDALEMTSVFDETTLHLPVTHLYAAYQDWRDADGDQSSKGLGARGFMTRITKYLEKYGFRFDPDNRVRPMSGAFAKRYTPEVFGHMANGGNFKDAVGINKTSGVFVRTAEDARRGTRRAAKGKIRPRDDRDCTVYEYLGIERHVENAMTAEERERDAAERAAWPADDGLDAVVSPGNAATLNVAWPNAAVAIRKRDLASLALISSKLAPIAAGEAPVDEMVVISRLDTLSRQFETALPGMGDPSLLAAAHNMDDASTLERSAQVAMDVIAQVASSMKSGEGSR